MFFCLVFPLKEGSLAGFLFIDALMHLKGPAHQIIYAYMWYDGIGLGNDMRRWAEQKKLKLFQL
jgi:hypothetical protein